MEQDTQLGGTARAFPSTMWELVVQARDPSDPHARDALDRLIRLYWKPVYAYIRRSWGKADQDAKDLTQGFFLELMENGLLAGIDRSRCSLRACLKTALEHFLVDKYRHALAKKRGGEVKFLDADSASLDEVAGASSDEVFDRAWADALVQQSLDELRQRLEGSGRSKHYEGLIRQMDAIEKGTPLSYDDLARELGAGRQDVANWIHRARVQLRRIIVERLRQEVPGTRELESELRKLFGDADV